MYVCMHVCMYACMYVHTYIANPEPAPPERERERERHYPSSDGIFQRPRSLGRRPDGRTRTVSSPRTPNQKKKKKRKEKKNRRGFLVHVRPQDTRVYCVRMRMGKMRRNVVFSRPVAVWMGGWAGRKGIMCSACMYGDPCSFNFLTHPLRIGGRGGSMLGSDGPTLQCQNMFGILPPWSGQSAPWPWVVSRVHKIRNLTAAI